MFQVKNKNTRTTSMTYFTPISIVSIVDSEQVNVNWVLRFEINCTRFASAFERIDTFQFLLYLTSLIRSALRMVNK